MNIHTQTTSPHSEREIEREPVPGAEPEEDDEQDDDEEQDDEEE